MLDTKREREYERETRELDREITALEERLERARDRVGELSGEVIIPPPSLERARIALLRAGHDGATAFWLGAPTQLRMRRRFEGQLPTSCFEHMLEQVREKTRDSGVVEQLPESLVFSSSSRHPVQPHFMVRLVVAKAGPTRTQAKWFTTLTITDRLDELAGRLFGTFGGIVGAGGFAAPLAASIAFPPLAPLFVAGWFGGVYGTSRLLYRKAARARAMILQNIFDLLVAEVEQLVE